jgi:hypothetical protein
MRPGLFSRSERRARAGSPSGSHWGAFALAVAVLWIAAGAAVAVVVPPHGGAGQSCTPDRIRRAVVNLPNGASVVVRHPARRSTLHYKGQRANFELHVNRQDAAVESETGRRLKVHARCD